MALVPNDTHPNGINGQTVVAQGPTTSGRLAAIQDLNVETLKTILCEVKRRNTEAVLFRFHQDTRAKEASQYQDGHSSYLGRVCHAWHSVMQSNPAFWTVIIAYVDTRYAGKSLNESPLHNSIRLSKALPLCVYLIRKIPFPSSLDREEYHSVKWLMAPLWEEIHRVRTLFVHTNHSSSLPDASKILYQGASSQLQQLMLRSNCEDSIFCVPQCLAELPAVAVYNNQLVDLRIDGRSLLILLEPDRASNLIAVLESIRILCITNLTPRVDRFTWNKITDLFESISSHSHLNTLIVDTFEIPSYYSNGFPTDQITYPSLVTMLGVRHTGGVSLQYLIHHISPVQLHLDRCPVTTSLVIPFCCKRLALDGISYSEYLIKTLGWWDGCELEVVACPLFTDDFIYRLQDGRLVHLDLLFANLRHLRIVDCPNFTPTTLLSFLEEWSRTFAEMGAQYRPRVTGKRSPCGYHVNLETLEVVGRSPKLNSAGLLAWASAVAHRVDWKTVAPSAIDRYSGCSSPTSLLVAKDLQAHHCQCFPCTVADACLQLGP